MALRTDFKDDVLGAGEKKRRYKMIDNKDGTYSFEEVTNYEQVGTIFGAREVNEAREAINKINASRIDKLDDILYGRGPLAPDSIAGANALKTLAIDVKGKEGFSDWVKVGTFDGQHYEVYRCVKRFTADFSTNGTMVLDWSETSMLEIIGATFLLSKGHRTFLLPYCSGGAPQTYVENITNGKVTYFNNDQYWADYCLWGICYGIMPLQ